MKGVRGGGAFAALLAAGGLYAWQNRDKIQNWMNSQRSSSTFNNAQPSGYGSLPATGETRRIGESDYQAPTDATDVQKDPFASGI